MTVDDGTMIDSRQPLVGDPGCRVTHSSLAGSLLWWTTVTSLVSPILDNGGPVAFAMLLGPRSVIEVRADDTLARTSLRKFLPGDTTTIDLVRTSMSEPLPEGYTKAQVMSNWDNVTMGTIGFSVGDANARWRFLDGNEFYLKEAGPSLGATVLVDTSQTLLGDPNLIGDDLISAQFENLEQRRLYGRDTVLVLPHTHRVEQLIRGYADWVRAARPVDRTFRPPPTAMTSAAASPETHLAATPVPVSAQFAVTGLLQDGEWSDPSNIEAARLLLQSRYDLKIGIWDLVQNPTLRQTLLRPVPTAPTPAEAAPVPPAAARRANKLATGRAAEREAADEVLATIKKRLAPLKNLGWEIGSGVRWFCRLPLTEPMSRWPGDDPFPLVQLELAVEKRLCAVSAFTIMYNQVNITDYVKQHAKEIARIAGSAVAGLERQGRPEIWRADGGWGDLVNWDERIAEIVAKTSQWKALFEPLCERCRQQQEKNAARASERDSNMVGVLRLEVGVDPQTHKQTVVVVPPDHEPGWEYLYLASELSRGCKKHADALQEFQSGHVVSSQPVQDPLDSLKSFRDEIAIIVSEAIKAFDGDRLTKALGPPGEPGDEVEIRRVAGDLAAGYDRMIDWAQRLRSAAVPASWRPAFWALSDFVRLPLEQIGEFSESLSRTTERVVADLRAGRKPNDPIALTLSISIDDEAVSEFNDALAALRAGRQS